MAAEANIEKKIANYAKARDILTYKFSSPSNRGVPDRVFHYLGRTLYLEIKAPNKIPSELQTKQMKLLRNNGIPVTWVDNEIDGEIILDNFKDGAQDLRELLNTEAFDFLRHDGIF